MFAKLFSGGKVTKDAHLLYQCIVDRSRNPEFFQPPVSVSDTMEGRFEVILLHLFLVERHMRQDSSLVRLRRALQEALVRDMDRSLREMGIGDMGIGKQMKKVGAALLGRLQSYNNAADQDDIVAFRQIIERNIEGVNEAGAEVLATYAMEQQKNFQKQNIGMFDAGSDIFPSDIGIIRK